MAQQDIDNAMSQKGLQKVTEAQNPDLILTASGGSASRPRGTRGACVASAAAWAESARSRTWKRTMIVSLYDAKTQSLIWRGMAQDTLNNNGNKNQQMVEKAVQKMFKQWPK